MTIVPNGDGTFRTVGYDDGDPLLPCPFCGGVTTIRILPHENGWMSVSCWECGATKRAVTQFETQMYATWNNRSRVAFADLQAVHVEPRSCHGQTEAPSAPGPARAVRIDCHLCGSRHSADMRSCHCCCWVCGGEKDGNGDCANYCG